MTRVQKYSNLGAVVVPFVGVLVAIVLLWNKAVGWTDLAIMVFMYLPTGLGVTVGFHRLLTHRSFSTYPWVQYVFAALGSMAVQGPVIDWVADHRKHHAHTATSPALSLLIEPSALVNGRPVRPIHDAR